MSNDWLTYCSKSRKSRIKLAFSMSSAQTFAKDCTMSQWDHLLENLGIWASRLTHFSAQGELIDDVPGRISLHGLEENHRIYQTVQLLSSDHKAAISERVLDYRSLLEYSRI